MSSCRTAPISTTASSASLPSPADPAPVVIACGALAAHLREIIARRSWRIELHCLPALLHNRPGQITPDAERIARRALARGRQGGLAYADWRAHGPRATLCARTGVRRRPTRRCSGSAAGPSRVEALFDAEPGTYVLTDFLVRSFRRTVLAELGLDRYPQLWPDYFGHYRRVVWLAQRPDPALTAEAERVAAMFGLPLTIVETGTARLERELACLVGAAAAGWAAAGTAGGRPAGGPRGGGRAGRGHPAGGAAG